MKNITKSILTCSILLSLAVTINAQHQIWSDIEPSLIPQKGTRYIIPQETRTLRVDIPKLQAILHQAPMEGSPIASMSKTLLPIPLPDGQIEYFNIVESPIIAAELSEAYPGINTYAGYSTTDPGKSIRLDLTPQGFHAIILQAGGTSIYIDPYSFGGGDIQHYISYYKKDLPLNPKKAFSCAIIHPSKKKRINIY